jgi:hypothetical protein
MGRVKLSDHESSVLHLRVAKPETWESLTALRPGAEFPDRHYSRCVVEDAKVLLMAPDRQLCVAVGVHFGLDTSYCCIGLKESKNDTLSRTFSKDVNRVQKERGMNLVVAEFVATVYFFATARK